MKHARGEYGYRNEKLKIRAVLTFVLAAAVFAQAMARFFVESDAKRNLLTVMAILTVLPMANIASVLLASVKYRSMKKSLYERISPFEDRLCILYDLILTTKSHVIPADVILVTDSSLVILSPQKDKNLKKAAASLEETIKSGGCMLSVEIETDVQAFLRVLKLCHDRKPSEKQEKIKRAAALLKSMTM